jgi:AraC-like DNA-binding protein
MLEIFRRFGYNLFVKKSPELQLSESIKTAVEYIDCNYDQQVTLADIAYEAELSVSRMAHLFKDQMGITPIDYLTEVRIKQAKRLLRTNEITWQQTAYEVGYSSPNYFTRIFKAKTGKTPKQFMENSN